MLPPGTVSLSEGGVDRTAGEGGRCCALFGKKKYKREGVGVVTRRGHRGGGGDGGRRGDYYGKEIGV